MRFLLIMCVLSLGGCAVCTQVPIREVQYDFSDYDFYDRGFKKSTSERSG